MRGRMGGGKDKVKEETWGVMAMFINLALGRIS